MVWEQYHYHNMVSLIIFSDDTEFIPKKPKIFILQKKMDILYLIFLSTPNFSGRHQKLYHGQRRSATDQVQE